MRAVVEKTEIVDPDVSTRCARKGKITVFHLIGSLNVGGAEQQLVSIASAFDKERFRIIVGSMQPGGGLQDTLAKTGIEHHCLNFRIRSFVPSVLRLALLLRREKVDILHTHIAYTSFYGRLAGLCARVPVMVTTDHGQHLWKKRWEVMADWVLNPFTAVRVAVTDDVAAILHTRDRTPKNKIRVIKNGVDVAGFRVDKAEGLQARRDLALADDAIVIGTIARLSWAKSLHVLVEAIAELVKTHPRVRCVIVGDGPLRGEIEDAVARCGMAGHVILTGTRMDVPRLLAAFDIFALSSRTEGLPISLLEAMSAEKPIVTTGVGGIPEVVLDHEEAIIVEAMNPSALADGIRELIDDPELARSIARKGLAKVMAQYSCRATVLQLQDLYCSLLKRHG